MEKTEITVEGYQTDSGKIKITTSSIARELAKKQGIEKTTTNNNVIYFSQVKKEHQLPIDYEYVNAYEQDDELEENKEENIMRLSKIVTCIKGGTKIVGRRKKGGKTR